MVATIRKAQSTNVINKFTFGSPSTPRVNPQHNPGGEWARFTVGKLFARKCLPMKQALSSERGWTSEQMDVCTDRLALETAM